MRKPIFRLCDQVRLQPACSATETWNFCYSKYRYYTIQEVNSKGADLTVRMRRLICAFVVCIWQVFSWCGSILTGLEWFSHWTFRKFHHIWAWAWQNPKKKITSAPCKASDQPGHPPSWSVSWLSTFPTEGPLDSDQTGWMTRLIWVFAGHMLFCSFWHALAVHGNFLFMAI